MGVGTGVLGREFSSECLSLANKRKDHLLRWWGGSAQSPDVAPIRGGNTESWEMSWEGESPVPRRHDGT